jgi:hypothetical protein
MAISPDGKSLAYTVEDDEYEIELFVWSSGKATCLGKDFEPVAVSNGAKYIYFISEEKSLYVASADKEKSKLCGDVTGVRLFNRDCSEIIFTSEDKTYISINGAEKVSLGKADFSYPLLPRYAVTSGGNTKVGSIIYKDSLLGQAYYARSSDGFDIVTLNKKCEVEKLFSDVNANLADDEKTITYMKGDSVYKGKLNKANDAQKIVEDEVVSFIATSDGKAFYYITEDDELMYKKGNADPKKISDDVRRMSISGDDVLFFLADYSSDSGTLFASSNGKEKVKIADDVMSVTSNAKAIIYYANDEDNTCDVFASDGGTKFVEIAKGTIWDY